MDKIRIGIVGIGNCASSLLQGIEYYRTALFQKSVILLTPILGKICVNRCQSVSGNIKKHRFH
jgi:myo-inositol-1-phosphate synthase